MLKYANTPNTFEELKIIQEYMKITGFYKSDNLYVLYILINVISCYKGLLMALSTEYYCFEKHKFSLKIMNNLFLENILSLVDNVKFRLEEVKKCQE